jgi:hypothetical protein
MKKILEEKLKKNFLGVFWQFLQQVSINKNPKMATKKIFDFSSKTVFFPSFRTFFTFVKKILKN